MVTKRGQKQKEKLVHVDITYKILNLLFLIRPHGSYHRKLKKGDHSARLPKTEKMKIKRTHTDI